VTHAAHLAALRAELVRRDLDGFLVPRADEHLGEYVPPNAERLAWVSGFTGSAGLAVVLRDRAVLFTDGRYTLQAASQTDPALWLRAHITEEPPTGWLKAHAPGLRIGYDPLLHSADGVAGFVRAGVTLVPQATNPVDAVWTGRPAPPAAPAQVHDLRFAGKPASEKRAEIAAALREAGQDAAVLTDPASICWLLNIRGGDVDFTPFLLGFGIVHADAHVDLICDPAKLGPEVRAHLGNTVGVRPRAELGAALDALAGKTVRVDASGSPVWFAQRLKDAGATVADGDDPCSLPRACKNATEQAGARAAHARDAVAVCRFLRAMESAAGRETEMSVAARLVALRAEQADFRGESFPAISGSGEDGAIIHYRVSAETDRPIRPNEAYLCDSGAQYLDGTTDITRTVWTGPDAPPTELRDRFTRVLKGHIALATLRFPRGVAGQHIDTLARRALWEAGLDFDHGTGHGVGSFLSVHEGPARISRAGKPVPLAPGMILSNEPGYYKPGAYGIRLENLLLVREAPPGENGRVFHDFETLTLAPFDRRLVDVALLTAEERAWLDAYHARVAREVGPNLPDAADRAWLEAACAKL